MHEATQISERVTDIPRVAMRIERAAESTGLSRTRLYGAIKSGELAAKKAGRVTIVEVAELTRWISELPPRSRNPRAA
jgi:hypothetical protein